MKLCINYLHIYLWWIFNKSKSSFKKKTLFTFRERGREGERERNIDWLPLTHPQFRTRPTTQACAPTGNWTCNPLVHRPVLNPLSHTNQGQKLLFLWQSFPLLDLVISRNYQKQVQFFSSQVSDTKRITSKQLVFIVGSLAFPDFILLQN